MHFLPKISGGACPRTPLANSASGASWPCRMQEPAWSGFSTLYFPFLGMPLHYMEQNLMCLLLLWLVLKWSTFQVKRPPPPRIGLGTGLTGTFSPKPVWQMSLRSLNTLVRTEPEKTSQDLLFCPGLRLRGLQLHIQARSEAKVSTHASSCS